MVKVFDGNGNIFKTEEKKHPIREMLEKGALVDGDEFETMLREEAEEQEEKTLKSIEVNLIQLNKTTAKILEILSNNQQG